MRFAVLTVKAVLAHLSQQQAIELASLGIRVNAVAPGPVDTAMAKAVHTAEIRAAYHDAIPLNRYGLEQELAKAIVFRCSDGARYGTGRRLGWAVELGIQALADQGCVPTSIPNAARAKISRVSRGDDAAPAPAYTKTYLATRSRKPISAKWCRPLRLVACTSTPEIPRCT
jgi:hypothetical protein